MSTSLNQYQQAIVNADAQLMAAQADGNTELAKEILSDINTMVTDMKAEHPDYQPEAVADTSASALESQLNQLQTSVNQQPVVTEQVVENDQSALLDSATTLNDGAQPINAEAPVVPVGQQSAVNQLLDVAEQGVSALEPVVDEEITSDVPVGVTDEPVSTEWKKEDSIIAQWGDGKFIIELPNGKYNF